MPTRRSPRKRSAKERRAIVLATPEGEIQFANATARRWLQQFFGRPARAGLLPSKICRWLRADPPKGGGKSTMARHQNAGLVLKKEKSSTDQSMLLVLELINARAQERARLQHGLTRREDEVLFWVDRGKSNREIAEILGIAPATVSKHLERAYPKLGVENRTAASSLH